MFDFRAFLFKKPYVLVLFFVLVVLGSTGIILGIHLTRPPIIGPITEEEAIEFSLNSPTMQGYINQNMSYFLGSVEYVDIARIQRMKEYSSTWSFFPNDHGVWRLEWSVWDETGATRTFAMITHFVDEMTGQIIWEGILPGA